MNWLEHKNAQDFLDATGLAVEAGLDVVDAKLKELQKQKKQKQKV